MVKFITCGYHTLLQEVIAITLNLIGSWAL